MDPVFEIKARLPIEELVGQYCQLKKKGREFVCVCPFHNDTHPSMQVSPDKGIAYCFACNSGGDVFSFYQKIEGVDFRQALKDLAERTGVKIEGMRMESPMQKDQKERIYECLESVQRFFQEHLTKSNRAQEYVKKRGISSQETEQFGLGYAPDSFSDTYQYLLKEGFSRKEIVDASLGIQKDLSEGKIYDRFRDRLMFPIHDGNGKIVGFGGRTLGDDDAKYINSGETSVYNKSTILYGLHIAKEQIREQKTVVLVEGYFDVIACHKAGIANVVAVSGTALTEQHVKILKRYAEKVVLCLDQDSAGKQASERAFHLCSAEELEVYVVQLSEKDPDESIRKDVEAFQKELLTGGVPYVENVLQECSQYDVSTTDGKRTILKKILPLLQSIQVAVERDHYLQKAASFLGTTTTTLQDDLDQLQHHSALPHRVHEEDHTLPKKHQGFSAAEIALGIMVMFPQLKPLASELIEPEDAFAKALYIAVKSLPEREEVTPEMLDIDEAYRERASILLLYCEHHGFSDWNEAIATREIQKNCQNANRIFLREKQVKIAQKLQEARLQGDSHEELRLSAEYQEVLKLTKMIHIPLA